MSTCYYPNGDEGPPGDKPCPDSDACCPDKWKCQSNGLCYLPDQNYYGRYTCTDQTWQSSGCPNICTKNNTAAGNEAILECTTGNYCCDANRPPQGCCDTSTDRFQLRDIGKGDGQATSPADSSSPTAPLSSSAPSSTHEFQPAKSSSTPDTSSTTTTPTQGSTNSDSGTTHFTGSGPSSVETNSPSISTLISVITQDAGGSSTVVTSSSVATAAPASSSPNSASTSSKNLGVIIGPVVGGVIGAILLAVLAYFLFRRRRRQKAASSPSPTRGSLHAMYGDDNKTLVGSPYTGKSELEGSPNMNSVIAGTPRVGNGYNTPDDVRQGGTIDSVEEVGGVRDSKGELAASPSTARTPQSRRSELPGDNAVRNIVGDAGHPAELPAGVAYKPYKPPGASGLGVEL